MQAVIAITIEDGDVQHLLNACEAYRECEWIPHEQKLAVLPVMGRLQKAKSRLRRRKAKS